MTREVVANTFNRHSFALCWSHAEMAPTIVGSGYDWTVSQTGKALEELIELCGEEPDDPGHLAFGLKSKIQNPKSSVTITCRSGDDLPHLADASVDAVVMDPPYYDNVMYAELSDFFYVWLKRTAGLCFRSNSPTT